ncbi:MAG: class I SAM-dependent methyltransferase [Piscinibacter sp.]|nr:class I SAM-dependent methyltransferase [Piscinibacter sp.]
MAELERAQARYRERDASATLTGFWTLRQPAVLHAVQERERVALRLLARCGVDLAAARVLDVGCGFGLEFANLLRWGVQPQALYGVDLMHERLLAARRASVAALVQGSITALPFPAASFDLVSQNVVFSSIVDAEARRAGAAEMLRVLRPGGWLLWYDACRTRAADPHFRAVPRADVEALFPGVRWHFASLTSDIGVTRRLQRWLGGWSLSLLDAAGIARTHLLGLAQKVERAEALS